MFSVWQLGLLDVSWVLPINVFCFTAWVAFVSWFSANSQAGIYIWLLFMSLCEDSPSNQMTSNDNVPSPPFTFTTILPQELEDIMHPAVLVLIKCKTSNCCLALLRYAGVCRDDISSFYTVGFSLYCMFVFCLYAWSPVCKLQFFEDLEFVQQELCQKSAATIVTSM